MRRLLVTLVVLGLGLGTGIDATTTTSWAQSRPDLSRVRVLAIAPFADVASLSRQVADYGAVRLSELATRRFQVIPPARVGDEMRRQGVAALDLISPSRTVALGQALGADAVLTGRVVFFMQERDASSVDDRPRGPIVTRIDVDVRVLDVASRVNVFQNTFICEQPSPSHLAMECVVRDVIDRIAR